jgi:hypothetical protein
MMGLRQGKFKGFVGKGAKGARAGGGWAYFLEAGAFGFVVVAWGSNYGTWLF